MKQETLKETAENFWLNDDSMTDNDRISYVNGFGQGAKWQQEKDKDFYFKYIKSEMDFQKPRIDKLCISTTNQIFEQQVTSLIHLAERSYSEDEVLHILDTFWDRLDFWYNEGVDENFNLREWFNECELKKK